MNSSTRVSVISQSQVEPCLDDYLYLPEETLFSGKVVLLLMYLLMLDHYYSRYTWVILK